MDDRKTFEISVISKIPYLTNGLLILCTISALIFSFIYSSIADDSTTPEMQTFYLIHTSTDKLLYISAFSTVISLGLSLLSRQKHLGLIIFNVDSFELLLNKKQQLLPFSTVRKVYCNDTEDKNGNPNKKFTMTIDTWKNKKIHVRLQNTVDIKSFVNKLLGCNELKLEYNTLTALG